MLNNNDEKGSDTSLEVKTDPTDSDLQTGCFTDVSYSGYFATKMSPETMSRNTSLSESSDIGTSTTDDNEKKQKVVESIAVKSMIEDTIANEEYQSDQQLYQDVEHKKNLYTNITPTPSPRIKKRLRREQFLQEHKQMGKEVLALAKTCTTQDMLICNKPLFPRVILVENK